MEIPRRIPRYPEPAATGSVTIRSTPTAAYRVISDPPALARFTAEQYAAEWADGATGAAVGARFRGRNRNGVRRWVTTCRITDADPGRCFAFEVTAGPPGIPVSRWQYDIAPAEGGGEGCTVTETSWVRAPLWFIPAAILITGIVNRPGANGAHIATTLGRLKAHLEAAPDGTPDGATAAS
ncbi:SRPBCC family protein [Streptomyces sp. A7024]|uniref:SRPBCC family protein n=1 Tax=Streptomyces coryli TaxID=1128680 RepID=A0A6G4UBZ9_9ACTN|nr:SRPBCC family protein [Streptomyces coryli]NGN69240.1 SRPBCC family protein [Streptomyces coryli]